MIVKVPQGTDIYSRDFISKTINDKLAKNFRLNKLRNYADGKQRILLREFKNDPLKPNNRIVVNFCKKIADFLTSYVVGVPVTYDAPQIVDDILEYNDESEENIELASDMNVYGYATELFYIDEDSIIRYATIDPRESIVLIDDSIDPKIIGYIRFYESPKENDGYLLFIYDDEGYTEYKLTQALAELLPLSDKVEHPFGMVPVILYENNKERLGSFEGIISMQDALNKVLSDEINDFEGFVDSYLVLEGMSATKPEDVAIMKSQRVLLLDPDSKAYWLTKNVNNDHISSLKDDLAEKIREISGLPDLDDLGALSSGTALRFKLAPTEIVAVRQERSLKKGIRRKLELIYNVLKISDQSIGDYYDVDVEFHRNFIMNSTEDNDSKRLDLTLVTGGYLAPETYLMRHEGFSEDEANEELAKAAAYQKELLSDGLFNSNID